MPSPVAANDLVPISGSVQTSRISYAVEPAGKNYGQNYNSTTWYSDIPNDGTRYTIVTDNYTANYYISRSLAGGAYPEGGLPAVDEYSAPVFWQTVGTSSLDVITIVNGLPDRVGETPFNSGSQALNWVASSSNYFAVGPDYYRDIDADNLGLYLEGNQIISYPTTGSTWYDVSGYNSKFTLLNGLDTGWNSNGWFNFDGTDDYATSVGNINSVYGSSQVTSEFLVRFTGPLDSNDRKVFHYSIASSTNGVIQVRKGGNNNDLLYQYNSGGTWYTLTLTGAIAAADTWYHFMIVHNGTNVKAYKNGALLTQGTFAASLDWTNADYLLLGYRAASEYWKGDIAKFRLYSSASSTTDVAQNYYGGPIVTDSLVLATDASNLVSYPKTGTVWYDLTANINGNLNNGPIFSTEVGGCFIFDGVDDRAAFSNPYNNPNFSIEFWANIDTSFVSAVGTRGGIVSTWDGGYVGFCIAVTDNSGQRVIRSWANDGAGGGVNWGLLADYAGKWTHFVLTFEGNTQKGYLNGVQVAEETFGAGVTNVNTLYMAYGVAGPYGPVPMKGSTLRCYDRTLTLEEIQQNYNATN